MSRRDLEQIYSLGLRHLATREAGTLPQNVPQDVACAFVLPLAVRHFQRVDQEDPLLGAPIFAHLSPREQKGCALLLYGLGEGEVSDLAVSGELADQFALLRLDRLAAQDALGNQSLAMISIRGLPIWMRAAFSIFQYALETGDGWDDFVELPDQIDLNDPAFETWLETTRHPGFWHVLVEHHAELLSSRALSWILKQTKCDIGTAASFAFRFGQLGQAVGASPAVVEALFRQQNALPKCTAAELTQIIFELCERAEVGQFEPVQFNSKFGLNVTEKHELLDGLGLQAAERDEGGLPLPLALLTRPLTGPRIASPYILATQGETPELYRRPLWTRGQSGA